MSLNTKLATAPNTSDTYILKASGTSIGNSIMYQDSGGSINVAYLGTTGGARIKITPDSPQGYIESVDASGNPYKLVLATGGLSVRNGLSTSLLEVSTSGAGTFTSTITSSDTYGLTLGSVANKRRIQYGSDVATSFTFLTDANGYAGLYASSSFFTGSITSASTAYGGVGGFIINYTGISSSRSWRLANDQAAFGDFAIQQSTTQTSSTYTSRLYIHPDGGVGINTTNPSSTSVLTLQESGTLSGALSMLNRNGNQRWLLAVDAYAVDDKFLAFIDATNNAVRMVIGDNGNVGISTSPSYKLDIRNDVAASTSLDPVSIGLYNGNDGGSAIYFRNSVGGQSKISFGVDAPGSGTDDTYLAFSTGSNTSLVERMRITSGGNLYYNSSTTPYNARVFVITDISGENGLLMKTGTDSGSYGYLRFVNAANQQIGGIFQASSTTLNYATSSDYRLKEDLKDFNGLDKISAIKVYDFKWKDSNERMDGVIAHELQEIIPYAVNGEKDALEEDGSIRTQSVDYSKIVPVLVKAIQEMNQTIQNQQQQINSLINR